MKKISLIVFLFVFMAAIVMAEPQGIHEPGTGISDPDLKEANQGTGQELDLKIQVKNKVKSGNYVTASGEQVQLQEQTNNRFKLKLKSGEISAETSMEMVQEQTQDRTKLSVKLSNGKNSEVKVMPNTASEKALERLRLKVCSEENGCSIELKEVGQGDQVKAAYEVQAQKEAKVLGMFKTKMQVRAQVDAKTGEVIQSKKPWWAFLASESEE